MSLYEEMYRHVVVQLFEALRTTRFKVMGLIPVSVIEFFIGLILLAALWP